MHVCISYGYRWRGIADYWWPDIEPDTVLLLRSQPLWHVTTGPRCLGCPLADPILQHPNMSEPALLLYHTLSCCTCYQCAVTWIFAYQKVDFWLLVASPPGSQHTRLGARASRPRPGSTNKSGSCKSSGSCNPKPWDSFQKMAKLCDFGFAIFSRNHRLPKASEGIPRGGPSSQGCCILSWKMLCRRKSLIWQMPWVNIDWAPCFGLMLKHLKQDRRLIRRLMKGYRLSVSIALVLCDVTENMIFVACVKLRVKIHVDISMAGVLPIGSMYAIFGNIYHQYTPMLAYIPYKDPMG